MTEFPLIFTDRSRIVTDWRCPRSRYYGYEYGGKGITKSSTNLALFTGISVHDSLAAIATFHRDGVEVPIDDIAEKARLQIYQSLMEASDGEVGAADFANEQASLTEGMLRGFYKYVWPKLMVQYPTIVAIEQEMKYDLGDGLIFMSKPDLIVEDATGEWVYLEYKTTSTKKAEWINSWNTAVQLHSSIKATEQSLGKAPTSVQIVGLYKGYVAYGKQSSPFCYCYKRNGNPPFTKDEIIYEYRAAFKKYPTWELPGGVKKWVEDMPDEVLADLFPMTPPIFVNEDLVNAFFRQTSTRERIIHTCTSSSPNEADLDEVFPQRFDQCQPAWGFPCEFKKLCHSNVKNPLEEGFITRTPHHQAELDQQNDSY